MQAQFVSNVWPLIPVGSLDCAGNRAPLKAFPTTITDLWIYSRRLLKDDRFIDLVIETNVLQPGGKETGDIRRSIGVCYRFYCQARATVLAFLCGFAGKVDGMAPKERFFIYDNRPETIRGEFLTARETGYPCADYETISMDTVCVKHLIRFLFVS
jgi:hypothetical protein